MLFWLVNLLYVLTTTFILIYCKNLCRYDFLALGEGYSPNPLPNKYSRKNPWKA